jgi:MFS superfamily sulfate permease-like transporter
LKESYVNFSQIKSNLKSDFPAGFSVFMIALPLSIGIAVASGAPPTAGIIAAVVGGMLGSLCNGNRLAINGPAAGLIVIVLAAVTELGAGDPMTGFRAMLACVVVAGILQMIMGSLRLGTLGLMFPVTVVHGMLAAIGLIIIAKQSHVALGVAGIKGSPLDNFLQLPASTLHLNPAIALIGGVSLAAMIFWPLLGKKVSGLLPAPLVAIIAGSALGVWLDLEHSHLVSGVFTATVGPEYLLNVPSSLKSALIFPDFSQVGTFVFWKHVTMITLVATAESILSTCAVDKLDPEKRRSNLNRDLTGKGLVNTLCGLIGGLPIITEIVRSSANVTNGARSQMANFLHGFFLLAFLVTVPSLLHMIPVASLAAVLMVVGFRLASPKHFVHAFHTGKAQGVIFLLTVVTILATDLLMGVIVGTLAELVVLAASSQTWRLFRLHHERHGSEEAPVIRVQGPVAFTNYLTLRHHLNPAASARTLTLDLRRAPVVDTTVREHLDSHVADFQAAGKELVIRRMELRRLRMQSRPTQQQQSQVN